MQRIRGRNWQESESELLLSLIPALGTALFLSFRANSKAVTAQKNAAWCAITKAYNDKKHVLLPVRPMQQIKERWKAVKHRLRTCTDTSDLSANEVIVREMLQPQSRTQLVIDTDSTSDFMPGNVDETPPIICNAVKHDLELRITLQKIDKSVINAAEQIIEMRKVPSPLLVNEADVQSDVDSVYSEWNEDDVEYISPAPSPPIPEPVDNVDHDPNYEPPEPIIVSIDSRVLRSYSAKTNADK